MVLSRGSAAVMLLVAATLSLSQESRHDDAALRQQALDLMRQNQMVQAEPILEGLARRHPDDMLVHEQLGMALLGEAGSSSDPEVRKRLRLQARAALLHAKELGDNSDLLNSVLPGIPEDGSETAFSGSQQVTAEMQEAESEFAHGDLQAAITHYQKAFELDPKQYYAAVFAGDANFKLNNHSEAAKWFIRAIAVEPDTETAHRYYADSLLAENKFREARTHYIEAIIADPYNRSVWLGLNNLHGHVTGRVERLHFVPQANVAMEGKEVKIDMAPAPPTEGSWGAFWLAYAGARGEWKKNHLDGASRTTSLREELAGYETAVQVIQDNDSVTLKAHPELARLKQIQKAGLLEAWVALDEANQEIANDYAEFRSKNRDKLRRYLDEFVIPPVQ